LDVCVLWVLYVVR